MKNVCFIGAFDKLDLILYISKILNNFGKKILIVDATQMQKSRYIVPNISPARTFITSYLDIDIAMGFPDYNTIENYLREIEGRGMYYDYALVNVDNGNIFMNFNNSETIKNYFVTSFDIYSIKRGLQAIAQIQEPIQATKVLFSREMSEADNNYLDYIASDYKIIWNDNKIYFPYETQDIENMIENQKTNKIKIRGLTPQYKKSLEYIITDIVPEININNLRKIMKNMEREG